MSGQRYYWLKLKKDFFKRHDIRILEGMENGHEIVLLYLKLLCESLDHDGALRFSDDIPYDADMLAAVTSTDKSIVETALETFKRLGLVSVDNGTIIMLNEKVMVGSETAWADKKRTQRGQSEDKVGTMSPICPQYVQHSSGHSGTMSDKSIEKENRVRDKRKRIEKDISIFEECNGLEKPAQRTRFSKPSIEEVKAYCLERHNNVDAEHFYSYYESNGWRVGKNPMKDWKACVRTWERNGIESRPTAKASKQDIPYLQNEYTKEQINSMVSDPMADLEQLLGGN